MQLMELTDAYCNFKRMANQKYNQMSKIISRQKTSETELRVIAGASPYMATLFSTLTTGNMKQYHRVADHFPNQGSS